MTAHFPQNRGKKRAVMGESRNHAGFYLFTAPQRGIAATKCSPVETQRDFIETTCGMWGVESVPHTHRYMLTHRGREIISAVLASQQIILEQLNKLVA